MITIKDIQRAYEIGRLQRKLQDLGVPKDVLAPIRAWLVENAKRKGAEKE